MPRQVRRGECAFCHREFEIRKDGRIRPHGPANRRCFGSGQPPEGQDTLTAAALDRAHNHGQRST